MITKNVKVLSDKPLVVVLEEDVASLDEVVVTGYQVLKKNSMAGATSSVKAEDLLLNGSSDAGAGVTGKVAGNDGDEHERVDRYPAEGTGTGNFHLVGKCRSGMGCGRYYSGRPASV